MAAQLLDGKTLATQIVSELKKEITRLGITPGLAVLLVGDDPASHTYVRLKEKAAADVGMYFEKILLPQNIEEELILVKIEELNRRADIHGILVQLPLPPHLNEDRITQAIAPEKDADGFHPKNIDALLADTPRITPNLLQGILHLLLVTGIPLAGKCATILANSDIIRTPLKKMLADRGITIDDDAHNANILITARGIPGSVTVDMVKKGAIVIDVGTTRVDGTIRGDVDLRVTEKASWLSPVPGGIGPLTVAYLLKNVVMIAKK